MISGFLDSWIFEMTFQALTCLPGSIFHFSGKMPSLANNTFTFSLFPSFSNVYPFYFKCVWLIIYSLNKYLIFFKYFIYTICAKDCMPIFY